MLYFSRKTPLQREEAGQNLRYQKELFGDGTWNVQPIGFCSLCIKHSPRAGQNEAMNLSGARLWTSNGCLTSAGRIFCCGFPRFLKNNCFSGMEEPSCFPKGFQEEKQLKLCFNALGSPPGVGLFGGFGYYPVEGVQFTFLGVQRHFGGCLNDLELFLRG